jgi:hypothetical protein
MIFGHFQKLKNYDFFYGFKSMKFDFPLLNRTNRLNALVCNRLIDPKEEMRIEKMLAHVFKAKI